MTPSSTSTASPRREPVVAGERLLTQFSRDQRGMMAAALVAFLGVVYVGPAVTRAAAATRRATKRTQARIRQLGGGTIFRARRAR
jgi:hypothetical protein